MISEPTRLTKPRNPTRDRQCTRIDQIFQAADRLFECVSHLDSSERKAKRKWLASHLNALVLEELRVAGPSLETSMPPKPAPRPALSLASPLWIVDVLADLESYAGTHLTPEIAVMLGETREAVRERLACEPD